MSSQGERLSAALAGRYRIERELGAGGMATVYLAEDLKHDRKVAIKVLKPELAAVLGAERFVVEIKTTAAMSHPHILPLFDSGTADGFLFYVMPYIQGETIREKLNRETQFGVDEAVRIAREVADALDYAHRHGVIHRDIKPENILLHDGRAMVMDFGIALAVSAAAGGRMTETGLSLGTPHYMSPEQATAEKEITARSDQYSLASVLYEMLAGDPPFTASVAQAVIMKIITEPAALVTTRRKNVPTNVDAALAKALEKLPADRFESAKAFADALGNAAYVGTSATSSGGLRATRGVSVRVAAALATAAVVATAVAVWALSRSLTPAADAVVRMTLELPPGERLYVGSTGASGNVIAISPQGDRIAYVVQDSAGVHMFVRRTGELNGRKVTDQGGNDLVFSPDGRWLAYAIGSEIRKVPSDGGPIVSLVISQQLLVRGLAWLPSDTIVVGTLTGLRTLPAGGGAMRPLAGSDTTQMQTFPVLLSDGKTLAFANGQTGARKLALLASGQARFTELDVSALAPIGLADGHLLYVAGSGAVMALPIDLARHRPTGDATPVEAGIRQTGPGAAMAALSATGTLWYVTGDGTNRLMLAGANGIGTPLLDDQRNFRYPRFSPDGRKVAVTVASGPASDIWVYDRVDRTFQKLTTIGDASTPDWTPDGKRIVFRSIQGGKNEVWWQPSDGSGKAEPLYQGELVNEAVVSPDGKWLVYRTSPGSKFSRDIFALPLTEGERKPVLLVGGPAQESHPRVSPDGKWLAYQSNEGDRFEVYVRPFPGAGSRTQVSTSGGQEPIWSRSGNALYYRTLSGITSVSVTTGASFSIRDRGPVQPAGSLDDLTHQNYDVSPDGRFVTVVPSGAGASAVLVHNWGRELREKLAAGK